MSDKCCGIFGYLFGHKFEARYSESATAPAFLLLAVEKGANFQTKGDGILQDKVRTYVRDVCQRCGALLPPEKGPSPDQP